MPRCVIAIAIAAAACNGKPRPPAQITAPAPVVADAAAAEDGTLAQDLPRLARRSLVMYQDVGQALADSREDCAAAAARLGQLAATYRDVVTANAKVLRDGRARQLQAALDPHGDAFDRAAQAIVQSPAMAACAQDAAFARAFDELLEARP
jgi:CxxC motif-containing protein (DUF1111 family)